MATFPAQVNQVKLGLGIIPTANPCSIFQGVNFLGLAHVTYAQYAQITYGMSRMQLQGRMTAQKIGKNNYRNVSKIENFKNQKT